MRYAWLVLAGCGRVAFDPRTDAAADVGTDAREVRAEPGLVAYYPFDEPQFPDVVLDVSGHERDGTCSQVASTCPTPTSGRVGGAASFDGTAMHVRVPFDPGFNTTSGFSIATWAITNDLVRMQAIMSKPYGAVTENVWQLFMYSGSTDLNTVSGAGATVAVGTGGVTANAWHHLAGTWDGTTLRMFLDGVDVGGAQPVNDVLWDSSDVILGADIDSLSVSIPFMGSIDEVRVYDRALSASEIDALANP